MNPEGYAVATPRHTWSNVVRALKSYPGLTTSAMLLTVGSAVASVGIAYELGNLTEGLSASADLRSDTGSVDASLMMVFVGMCVFAVLSWGAARCVYTLGEHVLGKIREEFVEDVLALPLSRVERAGTGELLARTTLDVDEIHSSITNFIPKFFAGMVTLAIYIAASFALSPLLACAILAAVLPLAVAMRWYLPRSSLAFHVFQQRNAQLTGFISESVDGAKTVEALRWQRRYADLVDSSIRSVWDAGKQVIRLRTMLYPVLDLTVLLPCLIGIGLGTVFLRSGTASLAEVVGVVILMQMAAAPGVEVVQSLEDVQRGLVSVARLTGLERDRAVSGTGAGRPSKDAEILVELSGVGFSYDGSRPALQDLDLKIHRGSHVAIVGPSGAGKTTIAKLVAGILEPQQGRIAVGGVDLREVPFEIRRGFTMLVAQDYHLFNDTLAENIRLGNSTVSDADIERALDLIGAGSWASGLPNGHQTRLGPGDWDLTPSQVQQISLARIIVADPELVILDEATSMMPNATAAAVEQAMNNFLRDRTRISIAHRMETAARADRILVVSGGRLVQQGSHAELVTEPGLYRDFWQKRFEAALEPLGRN
jgi:ABC-type multidrug transport system fused ATPase/permease subunit